MHSFRRSDWVVAYHFDGDVFLRLALPRQFHLPVGTESDDNVTAVLLDELVNFFLKHFID